MLIGKRGAASSANPAGPGARAKAASDYSGEGAGAAAP
jgi:hypothetical protein